MFGYIYSILGGGRRGEKNIIFILREGRRGEKYDQYLFVVPRGAKGRKENN